MKATCTTNQLISFIWKFIRKQPVMIFFIFLFSLIWSIDSTLWPYILGQIIDTLKDYETQRSAVWPALKALLICGLSLWILVELGFRTRGFLIAYAFPKMEAQIRMNMFDHIQHHSPKYFNDHFAGSLSNKISDMTTQVTLMLDNFLCLFLPTVLTCFLTLFFFFKVSPLFALILAGWIIVHFGICFAFTKKCADYSDIHGEARTTLVGKIVDSLTNNFAVNLFYRFRFEKQQIALYQKEEQKKNTRSQRYVQLMFVFLSVIFIIGGVSLNAFMLIYWEKERISTGEIIQIFNTTWNVIFTLWFSSMVIPQFFQALGIAKQALSLMYDPQDLTDPLNAKALKVAEGEIVFENVFFHYENKDLFTNLNVKIKGGEKVGLVGFSGAGKSTFVNLILRFFQIDKGKILIDGQDIAETTLESLRNQVSLIPQDPLLFHRTIEENIHYGKIEASKNQVIEAAQSAHCDKFIDRTPQGYSTEVGERGTKLSGGERQRVAIARALLANTPILILDEATSALDSVTERYIQDSLEKLMQNRTILVIAHRLSTLSKMDRILVFDQGKIIEEGTHHQLLEQSGHYARLWEMQAGGFLPDNTHTHV